MKVLIRQAAPGATPWRGPAGLLLLALVLAWLACSGPARAQGAIPAQAGPNSLSGNFPTRGFGDCDRTDVWVPFTFFPPAGSAVSAAQVVLWARPIGADIGTDVLLMKGASGTVYTVYSAFNTLPANQWSEVRVNLSSNPDLLAAIAAGRLEACVQDDTAVSTAQLSLTAQPESPDVGGADWLVTQSDGYTFTLKMARTLRAANGWVITGYATLKPVEQMHALGYPNPYANMSSGQIVGNRITFDLLWMRNDNSQVVSKYEGWFDASGNLSGRALVGGNWDKMITWTARR